MSRRSDYDTTVLYERYYDRINSEPQFYEFDPDMTPPEDSFGRDEDRYSEPEEGDIFS